jgi:hypothetical protein
MKLRELYAVPTKRGYAEYLKSKGLYKKPTLTGKKGYVLKNYYPNKSEKSYPTVADAKHAAPKTRDHHWQIFDSNSGEIVGEPEWVYGDSYWNWAHKEGY